MHQRLTRPFQLRRFLRQLLLPVRLLRLRRRLRRERNRRLQKELYQLRLLP